MSRLFFSYSRADAEFVLRLAGDLRVAGIDLWLDQEDIPPGERWDRAVEDAMKSAPTLLVVLSRVSVASQNVLDEISYGLEAGKRIIPVLHQECDIPFRLRRLQYVDFTVSYEKALAQLVKAIRGRDQPEAVAAVAAVLPMASEPVSRTDPIDIASPAALPPMTHAPAPAEALREPPPPVDRTPTIVRGPSPIESRASPSGRRYMYALAAAVIVIVAVAAYMMRKDLVQSAAEPQGPSGQAVPAPVSAPAASAGPSAPAITPNDPGASTRYTVRPCGSIHDARTDLEWFVGPDTNTTWHDAERWAVALAACGGGWQLPAVEQLQSLYDRQATAGTGYFTAGRHFPARMNSVFAAIGGGSWVWAREASGSSGRTFNFNQGVAVETSRTDTTLAIRAFAVRPARSAATS